MAQIPRTPERTLPPPAPLPNYLRGRYNGEGRSLKLKRLLLRHNLTIAAMSRAIVQANGVTISRPSMQQLVTYGIVPSKTPFETIKAQAESWLATHGIPAAEIATAFDLEDGVVDLDARPADVQRTQSQNDLATRLRNAGVDEDLIAQTVAAAKQTQRSRSYRKSPAAPIPLDFDPLEKVMLTPDAKRHFELFRDPFAGDPESIADIYVGKDQAYVRDAMWDCMANHGFVAVIGESGSGKTVARHELIERLAAHTEHTVVIQPQIIDKTRLTAQHLGEAIIKDLDPSAVVPQNLEAQPRLLGKMLEASSRGGNRHLVIIEEAHDLTKPMLKQLKRFHELRDGFRKLLGILLIGQPELKPMLDERTNWDAREVIRRIQIAELLPLHGSAVQAYIEHKMKRAGSDFKRLLDTDAVDAIRLRLTRTRNDKTLDSQLYPLVINNLITRAANEAASLGLPRINADIIKSLGVRS